LSTLLVSSLLQGLAMTGFVVTQDEWGLYGVAAAFGVGFSALIPAYVLAVREYFPAREASWRFPVVLLLSGSGMATGTWLAGALYDYFGFYAPAFAAGVGFNILNFIVIATLVLRRRIFASAIPA
jgi:MFS family permease